MSLTMRETSTAGPLSVSSAVSEAPRRLDALTEGPAALAARFRFDVVTGEWWWSSEMYALHGYTPGEVEPSTELLLSHKHPEDRERTEGTLRGVLGTGETFCCRHRILDTAGEVREVLSVGEGTCDPSGHVVAVQGYFVDLTSVLADVTAEDAARGSHGLPTNDAVIEQAKGILIGAYRLEPDAAFELLSWGSRQSQIDLPVLAQGLVGEFSAAHTNAVSPAMRAGTFLGLLTDLVG